LAFAASEPFIFQLPAINVLRALMSMVLCKALYCSFQSSMILPTC
jgi:hypothetical protein